MKRIRIDIVGQSGSGLLTVGHIVSYALKNQGYFINSDREYPSLIKGGHSLSTINVSDQPIYALSNVSDVMLALDKQSLVASFHRLKKGGILLHAYERTAGIRDILEEARAKGIKVISLPGRKIAEQNGGNELMVNMVLTGMLWRCLGQKYEEVAKDVEKKFKQKPEILKIALDCLEAGFDQSQSCVELPEIQTHEQEQVLLDGNYSLALGAIHAGVRVYVAYPMSPSSSILSYLSKLSSETGMVIKQGEDEITVAQMTLGAMFAGTRALCATSGGGFDLMTETVSLAGIIENPFVIIDAQRPGPATGLPTWTCQGDLNLAIHGGHGEFSRVVIAVSDPTDCFELIQHAFNIAEEYQTFVMVLTEKLIAESYYTVPKFEQGKIPIKRGLVSDESIEQLESIDRFKITENGVSARWYPGQGGPAFFANSDEHDEMGRLTEEADLSREMISKRLRKMDTIKNILPDPEFYGHPDADISFIGWGSSKNIMRDIIVEMEADGIKVNYLHYSYVYPLREAKAQQFFAENQNVHLIENNALGQFGSQIEAATKQSFKGKLLKWNGRPFFIEDVKQYIVDSQNK